jgi:hypothetical protein
MCFARFACFLSWLQVISVEPPNFVELEVVDTPPGVKGNTASGERQQQQQQQQHSITVVCGYAPPQIAQACKQHGSSMLLQPTYAGAASLGLRPQCADAGRSLACSLGAAAEWLTVTELFLYCMTHMVCCRCVHVTEQTQDFGVSLLTIICACCAACWAAGGGSKKATLETGAVIDVPLFINVGEMIKVDARTETYLNRAKE